jgi:uncharacterized protein YndB with AHSA1/START domain
METIFNPDLRQHESNAYGVKDSIHENHAVIQKSIHVSASREIVWDALTNPLKTRLYTGKEVVSEWQPGSPIAWKDTVDGLDTIYEKGYILNIDPVQFLQYSSFTTGSGVEDIPSHYTMVTLELTEKNGGTDIKITHGDFSKIPNGDSLAMIVSASWDEVLNNLKEIIEA